MSEAIVWVAIAAFAQAASSAPAGAAPAGQAGIVTLITGDQVVVSSDPRTVRFTPGKGRERIRYTTRNEPSGDDQDEQHDHVYVIPEDALPLIASGKLDRELFDVTALLEYKYDNAARQTLPLLVTYDDGRSPQSFSARSSITAAAPTTYLHSINGAAIEVDKKEIGGLWISLRASNTALANSASRAASAASSAVTSSPLSGARKIWLDRLMKPTLDKSVPQIGAPAAQAAGYTGEGVVVAVLDSGIDTAHPDLAGKVIAERNFVAQLEPDGDLVGHGTHVASIIAGSGAASGGRYVGVAPGARLISGKVCASRGCPFSSTIAGMEWAVSEGGAKIVNMSLGGRDQPGIDPVEEAVNRLTAQYGTLFVVAVGNFRNVGPFTVASPASADAAFAVGAVDSADRVADFSGRGPRLVDKALKPQITAPGVGIVAARANGTSLGEAVGDSYVRLNGTSMATPHVAGAAALVSQQHPDWRSDQLKAALINSAKFDPAHSVFDYGAGRVDVAATVAASVIAEPASLSLGVVPWPHEDDEVVTRTITYRNLDTLPVTLALSVAVTAADGNAAPTSMFSVAPATLTIPAGATAAATLTVNTRVTAADGIYSGRLTGTADGKIVSTLVAIEREEESYDLTLKHIAAEDVPVSLQTAIVPIDKPVPFLPLVSGDTTVRLPAGRYFVESIFYSGSTITFFAKPNHVLAADASLTFDAREAEFVTLEPPTPTSALASYQVGWELPLNWSSTRLREDVFQSFPSVQGVYTKTLGEPAANFFSYLSAQWDDSPASPAQPDPTFYAATWVEDGTLPTGPAKSIPRDKMAVVHATYSSAFPDTSFGVASVGTVVRKPGTVVVPATRAVSLPQRGIEYYYSNDATVRWNSFLDLIPPTGEVAFFDGGHALYRPSQHYYTRWNEPPFGPAFPPLESNWAARRGDQLVVVTPLYGDRAGHAGFFESDFQWDLYRNGERIGGQNSLTVVPTVVAPVPPEAATYRLESSSSQLIFGLSTSVSAAWTFASEHVGEDTEIPLPLMTIRFKPSLNKSGQTFRNAYFQIPVRVEQLPTARLLRPSQVSRLTVDVSFNDGSSWEAVPVMYRDGQWVTLLKHPPGAEYVSLRASASDYSSNSVEQTIIRAYQLIERPRRPHP